MCYSEVDSIDMFSLMAIWRLHLELLVEMGCPVSTSIRITIPQYLTVAKRLFPSTWEMRWPILISEIIQSYSRG